MRNAIYWILIIGIVFSCGKKNANINLHTIKIDSTQQYSENDFVEKTQIIPLKTNKNYLIGNIDKMCILLDKIWILDKNVTKKIFVFNLNGEFITTIGKIGKGPGEYTEGLVNFYVDSARKEVGLVVKTGILMKYDLAGNYKESHRFKKYYPTSIIPVSEKYILGVNISCNSLKYKNNSYKLCVTDRNFENEEYFFKQDVFKETLPFDFGENLYTNNSEVYFRKNCSDTVYKYEKGVFIPFTYCSLNNPLPYLPIIDKAAIEKRKETGINEIKFINKDLLISTFNKKFDIIGILHSYKTGRSIIGECKIPLLPYPFNPSCLYKGYLYGYSNMLEIKQYMEEIVKYASGYNIKLNMIDSCKNINNKINLEDNPYIIKYKLRNF